MIIIKTITIIRNIYDKARMKQEENRPAGLSLPRRPVLIRFCRFADLSSGHHKRLKDQAQGRLAADPLSGLGAAESV